MPPLLPPHAQSRGGRRRAPAALGLAALGARGGRDRGEKEEGRTGNRSPSSIRGMAAHRGGAMAAGDGRPWLLWWRHHKAWRRPEAGAEERGDEGVPTPSSPWAEVPCGGSSTGVGGGRRCSSGRRRWGSRGGARATAVVCGACGLCEEAFYRRDEAVEEGRGGGGGRRASRPVGFNGSGGRCGVVTRRWRDSRRFQSTRRLG